MELKMVDFSNVRNRNEKMVLRELEDLMSSPRGQSYVQLLSDKDYQDVYALALNHLPARYAQTGTIIIGNPVRQEDATQAVFDAFETVLGNPKE